MRFNWIWIHIVGWSILFFIPLLISYYEFGSVKTHFPIRFLQAPIVFYMNYLVLVPYLLLKKRVLWYVLISIVFLALVNLSFDHFNVMAPIERIEGFKEVIGEFPGFQMIRTGIPVLVSITFFLLGGIIRIIINYYKKAQDSKEREVERVNFELKYLKSQLSPHFLFNSLNSIYSLVRSKSDNAPEAVLQLSGLMRYMLYEANQDYVPLQREMDYISDYISLQKLRLSNTNGVKLKIEGDAEGKSIYPLLLISYVENAFKYGVDNSGITRVVTHIHIYDRTLSFSVRNAKGLKKNEKKESSGIGLQNIKERLELLYKNSYDLKIRNEKDFYEANLNLTF